MSVLLSPPGSPAPQSGETSYANMNNDESAKYRREVLEILSSLRSLGLSQVLDLPQIAVIGSQSSGKSSLIEALCKIKLPRSTGTCTRCPIECRSQYANHPWRARVFLKLERENQDVPRWGEEIPFGDPIDDPELIEERIKRAQTAVLHPRVDPAIFLNGGPGPDGGLSFTKNCVLVKISGHELADLSFVDLPGIIASTADPRNKGDIKLVQKLISSYMQRKSTINLIVITCESDIETQGAGLIARNYDPTGERTIGVLTKPDRIEAQQERQWIPLITGESNPLTNGWFCVKQLGTNEREAGLTWEDARIQESNYFDTAPGWSAIPEEYRANLGSRNLAFKLGQVLSNEIQKRLPTIRVEVERLIKANDIEFQKLPSRSPHGPRDLVYHLMKEFVRDVEKQLIKGSPGAGFRGVVQRIRKAHVDLRVDLQQAAPVFLPHVNGGQYPELPRPSFLPADEIWLSRSPCGNEYNTVDVAEYADGARTREWPGHYPFQVMLDYTELFVKQWKLPVDQCFETACSCFESKLLELVGDHFSPYSYGGLMDEVKAICMELIGRCRKDTTEALAKDLDQEAHPESTHEELYLAYERQYSDYYRDFFDSSNGLKRLAQALELGENSDLFKAISVLEQCGLPLISPSGWRDMHPTNKSDRAVLSIMSSVRAHYQIAYKRFADKVKETVDQTYVRAFGDDLEDTLRRGLRLGSSETPEEYFSDLTKESEDLEILRRVLKDKAKKLNAARIKLS